MPISKRNNPFMCLMVPHMKLSERKEHLYHVYKSESEFEAVEAATATEAIEKSTIDKPCKIELQLNQHASLFQINLLATEGERAFINKEAVEVEQELSAAPASEESITDTSNDISANEDPASSDEDTKASIAQEAPNPEPDSSAQNTPAPTES